MEEEEDLVEEVDASQVEVEEVVAGEVVVEDKAEVEVEVLLIQMILVALTPQQSTKL